MRLILTAIPRTRALLFQRLILLSCCFPLTATLSKAQTITATIDAAKTGAPISKNIYGQFLEHGGDIVNTGIWSEMLVDRKFFYPVSTVAPTPPPAMGNAAGNPRFEDVPKRWWSPVGGDSVVTMDSKAPYTGDQSPTVRLSVSEPHGLRQSGLSLRAKKTYSGRIVLKGTPGTVVRVALIGNNGAAGRKVITIHALSREYRTYRLRYTAADDSDNATLEITATGTGEFHVGAASLMPSDNINGFRPEVIAVLNQLRFGVLRFPGGNFVSSYEWRYGVGDIDKRPPIFDPVWHALQPNDVGHIDASLHRSPSQQHTVSLSRKYQGSPAFDSYPYARPRSFTGCKPDTRYEERKAVTPPLIESDCN